MPTPTLQQTDRQKRIADNIGLARKVARRWANKKREIPFEEFLQIACEGLIKGIDRHDPAKGSFSTFILKYCNGEILHYLRDKHSTVKIPRSLQEKGQKLIATRTKLASDWGRTPTRGELAEYLRMTVQEVDEATLAMSNHFEPQTTEDLQLASKEDKGTEGSDRFSSVVALVKAMDVVALIDIIEGGKLSEADMVLAQAAIEEIAEFLVPTPTEVEIVDEPRPLAKLHSTGEVYAVDRVEGEMVVTEEGLSFPIYNMELNPEAIALMTPDQISAAINIEDGLAKGAAGTALYRAYKAGLYLLVQKSRLQWGEWYAWIARKCPRVKERSVQVYCRIAQNWDKIVESAAAAGLDLGELTIADATKLIATPSENKPKRSPAKLPPSISEPNVYWRFAAKVDPVGLNLEEWDETEINQLLENLETLRSEALKRLNGSGNS